MTGVPPDSGQSTKPAPIPFKVPSRPIPVREHASPDATLEFASESAPPPPAPASGPRLTVRFDRRLTMIGALGLLLVLAAAGAIWADRRAASAVATGSVRIESEPVGADVFVGGTLRGKTPLTVTLPAGDHAVTVNQGNNSKQLS